MNNSSSNNIKNNLRHNQIENEIPNRNQNIILSQNIVKQEIPVRNSQVLSGSQNRKIRQNSLNNRYPTSSYKRSGTQTSKCIKLISI